MAITVPTYRDRTINQDAISGQRQQINAPASAFGTLQADAMVEGGNTIQRLGAQWHTKAINIQDENNELFALKEKTDIGNRANDLLYNPEGGLLTKKGQNALGAPQEVDKFFNDLQKQYDGRTDLNPAIRQLINKQLLEQRSRYLDVAKRHQLQEYTTYKTNTIDTAIKSNVNDIALNYLDDKEFQKKADENFQLLQSLATSEGWDEKKLAYEKTRAYSQMRGVQIESMIDSNDPNKIILAGQVFNEAMALGQIKDAEVISNVSKKLKSILPAAAAQQRYAMMKQSVAGNENIRKAATIAGMNGIDPEYAAKVALIESRGIANAQNPKSSAGGIFQFTDGTAQRYGLMDKMDVSASSVAFVKMTQNNIAYLRKAIGREPTGAELYMAHQQGEGGAAQLLKNPMRLAVNVVGRDAVINNGGTEDMTAADFTALWQRKYDSVSVPYAQDYTPGIDEVVKTANELDQQIAGAGKELLALHDAEQKMMKEQKDARKNELQDTIAKSNEENRGDWTKLPSSVRSEAAALGIDVTAYKGVSDPDVKAEIDAMPNSQFFALDLNQPQFAQSLTYSDRQDYMKKQKELAKPENKFMVDTVDGVVNYYFRSNTSGDDGDPFNKDNKQKVAAMKNYVLFKAQQSQLAGKTPTKDDISKFASEYLPLVNKTDVETISDISESQRNQIEKYLADIGVEPTESAIMAIYFERKKQQDTNSSSQSWWDIAFGD